MGRFYRLSKKISEQEASEITREILELPDIQNAEIVDGNGQSRNEGQCVCRRDEYRCKYFQPRGRRMRAFLCGICL